MKLQKKIFVCLVLLVSLHGVYAQQIPPKPNPPRLVNDFADVLSAEEENLLERKLVAYDDTTSTQIAVVTIRTLNDYPIEEFALRLFREWGIGNKTTNNGVLILAAIDDREIRIEPGYGLEGAIPDITDSQIIRNDIAPSFRGGDYYEGLDKATSSLISAATGEYKAPPGYRNKRSSGRGSLLGIGILLVILFIIFRNIRGGGGGFMSRRGYRGWSGVPPLWWFPSGGSGGGGWSSGGGGWSGGGGGFGGFGGGSSGGGGASGSW